MAYVFIIFKLHDNPTTSLFFCSVYGAKYDGPTFLRVSIHVPFNEKDMAHHRTCLDTAAVPTKPVIKRFREKVIWHQIGSQFQEDKNRSDGKASKVAFGAIMQFTIPMQMVNLCMVPGEMIRWGANLKDTNLKALKLWESLGRQAGWESQDPDKDKQVMLNLLVKPAMVAQIASQDL